MTLTQLVGIATTLLGGGLAGALLTYLLQRHRSKTKEISLVERVNRDQDQLHNIRLMRVDSDGTIKGAVTKVRIHQMTLQNASGLALSNSEIQFDFPAADVDAWVSRPSRSKATPIRVDVQAAPNETSVRWRLPKLVSGDAVEFSFQLVEPTSAKYEAALYGEENVVLVKRTNDLPPVVQPWRRIVFFLIMAGLFAMAWFVIRYPNGEPQKKEQLYLCSPARDGKLTCIPSEDGPHVPPDP